MTILDVSHYLRLTGLATNGPKRVELCHNQATELTNRVKLQPTEEFLTSKISKKR